ncbi:hypothetical protein GWI33_002453 [Rhynchophorus ferrugineus]|uniref:C2H2-type domain-containing protein n=1 Tax=Rhynchophorus ferrugineus TaxID=354439 RepID=A0A834MLI9_RHYFE|nr:hypothetical protein GWI33_002453 [Rhynchophorus ferrugineus]
MDSYQQARSGYVCPNLLLPISSLVHPSTHAGDSTGKRMITTPDSSLTGVAAADLLVPGRVIANSSIPQGTMTVPIDPSTLVGKIDIQQVSVDVTSFGTLDLDKSSKETWTQPIHWLRAIRLSEDCHSYNIQLKLQPSYRIYTNIRSGPLPKLVLQVVRPISAGQELLLWFSEDILAMLQVVFLIPSNIQGQKKYVCLRCSTLYESPNPLKLHITLACGKFPISSLWARLASLMKENQSPPNEDIKSSPFDLILNPDIQKCRQKDALDLTIAGQQYQATNKELYRPYAESSSAFKPFKKEKPAVNRSPVVLDHRITDMPTIWPITFDSDVVQLHRNLMQSQQLAQSHQACNDDAQIESLVSSLGKAKQGHICLYCGKCYSRKYGLKIHIRTHTGYKPLKCKFCDRPFGDPSNLNKHVRLHAEGNTPYKCDLCGKILVRRRDLERHLKSRHMIEMHPGQDIIPPDSPVVVSEDSNSLQGSNHSTSEHLNSPKENVNPLEEIPPEDVSQRESKKDKEILEVGVDIKMETSFHVN